MKRKVVLCVFSYVAVRQQGFRLHTIAVVIGQPDKSNSRRIPGPTYASMVKVLFSVVLAGVFTFPLKFRHQFQTVLEGSCRHLRRRIQVLDNRGIVVRLSGSELRYLANAQWSDLLPSVIQARLVAGLENTGLFGGVGMPGQGLAIDYQVVVEIREFAIDAAGPGTADVELSVKLLDDRTGVVRAQRLFESSVGVNPSASSGVLVAALDKAFADVQAEIVGWIAATL